MAEAGAEALANVWAIHQGRDSRAYARVPTFAQAVESVIKLRGPTRQGTGDTSTVMLWRRSLERFA